MGGLHVPGSGGSDLLPSPGSGTRLRLTCPWGPAAGPGLASGAPRAGLRKWEWSEPASGRGQGALGAEAAVAIGEEEQAWLPRCRAGGAAGKAREGIRAGTGPPPFFGSLAGRGGPLGRSGQQSRRTVLRPGSQSGAEGEAALGPAGGPI